MMKPMVAFRYFANAPKHRDAGRRYTCHTLWPSGSFNVKNSAAGSLVCKKASQLSTVKFFLKAKSVLDMYCPPALVT